MDESYVDWLARSLGPAGFRRRALIAAFFGIGTFLGPVTATDARKKKKGKGKKKKSGPPQPSPPPPPPTSGPCAATVLPGQDLQAALDAAPSGATVCLVAGNYMVPGRFGDTHDLELGIVTLQGAGAGQTIIQGSGAGRGVIQSLFKATLSGLTITGGNFGPLEGGGAGIVASGELTIVNCTISGNVAGNGGGIYVGNDSSLFLDGCTITGNIAHRDPMNPPLGKGGGVFNLGQLTRTNTAISGNTQDTGPDCFNASSGTGC
jgi:hypothetical protein